MSYYSEYLPQTAPAIPLDHPGPRRTVAGEK